MSDTVSEAGSTGHWDLDVRIDEVCDRFEAHWKAGMRPRIEDYLEDSPAPARAALLRELIPLDMEYRRRQGETPTWEEYDARFPQFSKEDRSLGTDCSFPLRAGHYRLDRRIGVGGMGEVYRVLDPHFNRTLAIKVLLEKHKGRTDFEQRFLEEAQILGQLQHPGIVPVHEIGRMEDGRPFFAMKLVKGQTLEKLLQDRPRPDHDLPRFLAIFEQICQTMASAHAHGVIHRDLKPANVMVGAFGEGQVMDWGLAKVLKPARRQSERPAQCDEDAQSVIATIRSETTGQSTQAGSVMGTLAFMPPEVARGQVKQHDERTDVFLLGGILCVILTGDAPYIGTEGLGTLAKGELEPAHNRLDACGADNELIELAKACLLADRESRPRDAGVVAERMVSYLATTRQARLKQAELLVKARGRKLLKWQVAFVWLMILAALAGGLAWLQGYSDGTRSANKARWEALNDELGPVFSDRDRRAREALESADRFKDNEQWLEARAANDLAKGILGREEGEHQQRAKRNEDDLDAVRRSEETGLRHLGYAFEPDSPSEIATGVDPLKKETHREFVHIFELADPWHRRLWNLADRKPEELKGLADDRATLRRSALDIIHLAVQLWYCNLRESAVQLLQNALHAYPSHFWINYYLGVFLSELHPPRYVEAHACWRANVAMRPQSPGAHYALGVSFRRLKKWDSAATEFGHAIALQRDFAEAHEELGSVLLEKGQVDSAIGELNSAIAINGGFAEARLKLGFALKAQGHFREAVGAYGDAAGTLAWEMPSSFWVRWLEQTAELEEKLPSILDEDEKLENTGYWCIVSADYCARQKHLNAASARLYALAFTADPRLANDLVAEHRYNAACAAALASAGEGYDATNLADGERVRLRRRALQWLRAHLTALTWVAAESPLSADRVAQALVYWQKDADLVGIRDPAALRKLPDAERDPCEKLWADVGKLLKIIDEK